MRECRHLERKHSQTTHSERPSRTFFLSPAHLSRNRLFDEAILPQPTSIAHLFRTSYRIAHLFVRISPPFRRSPSRRPSKRSPHTNFRSVILRRKIQTDHTKRSFRHPMNPIKKIHWMTHQNESYPQNAIATFPTKFATLKNWNRFLFNHVCGPFQPVPKVSMQRF